MGQVPQSRHLDPGGLCFWNSHWPPWSQTLFCSLWWLRTESPLLRVNKNLWTSIARISICVAFVCFVLFIYSHKYQDSQSWRIRRQEGELCCQREKDTWRRVMQGLCYLLEGKFNQCSIFVESAKPSSHCSDWDCWDPPTYPCRNGPEIPLKVHPLPTCLSYRSSWEAQSSQHTLALCFTSSFTLWRSRVIAGPSMNPCCSGSC